jgi:hypothetical protein
VSVHRTPTARAAAGCVAVAFVLSAAAAHGGTADTSRLPFDPNGSAMAFAPRKLDLPVGERLVYEIRWSGVPAGRAVLAVKWKREVEGREVYHVECEANSNSFVALVYPVEDRTITLIDVLGGYSRLFEMSKNEGHVKQNEHIVFDYENGLAIYEQRAPGPFRPRSRKAVRIDGPVQDPLSCLYHLRSVELVPGATLTMPVHTARRPWELHVNVLKREELSIPRFGTLKTLRIEPTMLFPGIFVRKGRITVWVDEDTRIPVLMNVDIPIGSIVATLVDAESSPLKPGAAPAAE